MSSRTSHPPFARHTAIFILLCVGTSFASAHIAARIAFNHHVGLLSAVLFRSAVTALILCALLLWRRQSPFEYPRHRIGWQLLLGFCIAIQSISIYSAVSRVPVGIGLLAVNTFPVWLALLTWLFGGPRPTAFRLGIMATILFGLLLALDIPTRLQEPSADTALWVIGISFAFLAAIVFALGMWITEHKLSTTNGSIRSLYTMLTVFICTLIAAQLGLVKNGLQWPNTSVGWLSLFVLSGLYAAAFAVLFILAPRLTISQNAPAMNIEPIASLSLGWLILGQALTAIQIIGGAVVVAGIITLASARSLR